MKIKFTHVYDSSYGWGVTYLKPSDFKYIDKLGENDIDGILYTAIRSDGKKFLLRDNTEVKKT